MPGWIVWAVVSPAISAAIVSPKSMPEVTPPAVITLPSLTTLAFSWVAPTRGNRSVKAQWVVARRPLSNPATPKMKAPVKTDVMYLPAPACRRTNSNGFTTADRLDDTIASAGDAEQVEGRTV